MKRNEQNPELLSQPIERHLRVSGLIQKILDRFGVVSLGDLCELNIEEVAREKGVGEKKVATLQNLIVDAQNLTSYKPVKKRKDPFTSIQADVDFASPLLFVPSLIKEGFRRLKLDSVEKLLRLEVADMNSLPSWGEKKANAAIALRNLYETALGTTDVDNQVVLGLIVPVEVLPDLSLSELTIAEFLASEGDSKLKGKAIQEAADLRAFLGQCFLDSSPEEDISEMQWRDVPLQVNSRVQDFLDKYQIQSLNEVEKLAASASLDRADGRGRIDALAEDNFGESSLTNLRNEIFRLKAIGLRQYRAEIICDLEAIDCQELDWDKIPLKLRVKARNLLKSCKARTVAEVHRIALRSQVPVPGEDAWKCVGEYDGFTQPIVDELRREINRLAKLGLGRYRFGEEGRPRNFSEFISRVRSKLDPRHLSILKSYFEGRTFDQVGAAHDVTKERVRQILAASLEKIQGFEDAASELMSPVLQLLTERLIVPCSEIASVLGCQSHWELR